LVARLLHISDLHFGPPLRQHLVKVVSREAHRLSPDLVVVSGDLTQRARKYQFFQVRHLLDQFPSPLLVVPGNHDVPLYNLFLRFCRPLGRYRDVIAATPDRAMVTEVEGLSVIGFNSTRSFTIDGGGLDGAQLVWAEEQFAQSPEHACRIAVVHHHFLPDGGHQWPIRRARYLLRRFADMGVEMVLVGHRHWARAERTSEGPLVVQAGTATSNRGKGQEKGLNSYNFIEVNPTVIQVACYRYQAEADQFAPVWRKQFGRAARGDTRRA